jgi:hypothetical protein
VLQCLPGSDPPFRTEAGHLANKVLELRVDRVPLAEGRSLLVLSVECVEQSYETLHKGIFLSSMVLDEPTKVVDVVGEVSTWSPSILSDASSAALASSEKNTILFSQTYMAWTEARTLSVSWWLRLRTG